MRTGARGHRQRGNLTRGALKRLFWLSGNPAHDVIAGTHSPRFDVGSEGGARSRVADEYAEWPYVDILLGENVVHAQAKGIVTGSDGEDGAIRRFGRMLGVSDSQPQPATWGWERGRLNDLAVVRHRRKLRTWLIFAAG